MDENQNSELQQVWDDLATDWHLHVGLNGDTNRRLNSDPVLWKMAGDVAGMKVLDAGCGTGYLSGLLHKKDAEVSSVDFSPKMLSIARKLHPHLKFLQDSVTTLSTQPDAYFDLLIANYVLMDVHPLEACLQSFSRVLKKGGRAVLVFSHPCFPQGTAVSDQDRIQYNWDHSYFERKKYVEPPWAHFKRDFVWFHRSLSDYFQSFKSAGFTVEDFEEPRLILSNHAEGASAKSPSNIAGSVHGNVPPELAGKPEKLRNFTSRPYSVAFALRKP